MFEVLFCGLWWQLSIKAQTADPSFTDSPDAPVENPPVARRSRRPVQLKSSYGSKSRPPTRPELDRVRTYQQIMEDAAFVGVALPERGT